VLDATGLARQPLSALRICDDLDHTLAAKLLAAMKDTTTPVKAHRLGTIGKEHLAGRFAEFGCEMATFRYRRRFGTEDSLPYVVETAFAWNPNGGGRLLLAGINWSPAIRNPFRCLGWYVDSLDSELANLRAGAQEPIVFLLHVASPRLTYADRGKSQVLVGGVGEPKEPEDELGDLDP
jgi:hypothetical protein